MYTDVVALCAGVNLVCQRTRRKYFPRLDTDIIRCPAQEASFLMASIGGPRFLVNDRYLFLFFSLNIEDPKWYSNLMWLRDKSEYSLDAQRMSASSHAKHSTTDIIGIS